MVDKYIINMGMYSFSRDFLNYFEPDLFSSHAVILLVHFGKIWLPSFTVGMRYDLINGMKLRDL